MPLPDLEHEAERVLTICNICNYCNGFCDVFHVAEQRRDFTQGDLSHLAHLCHNCRNCLDACQFAAPHPFQVHIPKLMADLRQDSYRRHALFPGGLAEPGWRGLALTVGLMLALPALLVWLASAAGWRQAPAGFPAGFYDVLSWETLSTLAGAAVLWAILGVLVGSWRYWRTCRPAIRAVRSAWTAFPTMVQDVLSLRNLGGSIEPGQSPGCNDVDDRLSLMRRRFHHGLFYGFALCFASTSIATLYHHLWGWLAPYDWFSLPVLLGSLGGVAMLTGAAGLMVLKYKSNPAFHDPQIRTGEYAALTILALVAGSGLLLLALRSTAAMPVLLAGHLGAVLGFFLTLPYGKLMHAPYRAIALLQAAMERHYSPKQGKADD